MNRNFIDEFIEEDLLNNPGMKIHTRFPPEPNGYLHIGHCKALIIDFSTAEKFGGLCNLRMDDTNPAKEDTEYVDAIKEDIHWLGFDWGDRFFYGSDYFDRDYEFALELIKNGDAYVCELTQDQMDEYRGDTSHPAVSPYRDRPVEESLDLFERMKNGEFEDGKYTLRAKIDLSSGNFWMRDPVIYRIKHIEHHRHGTKWCIFPMYDFAHPIQDAIEGVTHSLCSLEYEIHRPLYNWVIEHISIENKPRQIEFARLNMSYTVLSKRFLRYMVDNGLVDGWDDPRMPTLCGLRRRGYTPESIIDFVDRVGVAKNDSMVDIELLEHCIREELNDKAPRRIAILDPIKVIIDNYPDDKIEYFELPNNPVKPEEGTRKVAFTKEIFIDRNDFEENPPPKYFRLKPDGEVRLMGSYIIKCKNVIKDENGTVISIHADADLITRNNQPSDRKIKGTIHWLSSENAEETSFAVYDKLYTEANMNALDSEEYIKYLNKDSIKKYKGKIEKCVLEDPSDTRYQFVRTGYYIRDSKDKDTFIQIVSLKDSFKK